MANSSGRVVSPVSRKSTGARGAENIYYSANFQENECPAQSLLRDSLEVVETPFEVLSGNDIHVLKNADELHDVQIGAVHGPGDLG